MSVFAHYRLFHPRALMKPRASGKEWKLAAARLAEGHTTDDLKAAIDGYHRSPFHLGDNDRGETYLSLELILRDSSHVLKGIEYAAKPPLNGRQFGEGKPARNFTQEANDQVRLNYLQQVATMEGK